MRWLLLIAALTAGCDDPVRDNAIEALGEEDPDVEPGPLHRPGQPCVLCHDGRGPGNLAFSLAGTVFQVEGGAVPLVNATLHVADSSGRRHATASNCAGNFFVQVADFEPDYPAWVWIEFGGVVVPMNSPIFREGSCAVCHSAPTSTRSAGAVYFSPEPLELPESSCD